MMAGDFNYPIIERLKWLPPEQVNNEEYSNFPPTTGEPQPKLPGINTTNVILTDTYQTALHLLGPTDAMLRSSSVIERKTTDPLIKVVNSIMESNATLERCRLERTSSAWFICTAPPLLSVHCVGRPENIVACKKAIYLPTKQRKQCVQ